MVLYEGHQIFFGPASLAVQYFKCLITFLTLPQFNTNHIDTYSKEFILPITANAQEHHESPRTLSSKSEIKEFHS